MPVGGTCKECRYFHPESEEGGQCRYNPPSPLTLTQYAIAASPPPRLELPGYVQAPPPMPVPVGSQLVSVFPFAANEMWCGKFKPDALQ